MKPFDVKPSTYINFNKENKKAPKFEVDDRVITLKYKNIFAKGYVPNWSEEAFMIKKGKTLCRGHMLLMILMVKKLLKGFTKKNCKKRI